MNVNTSLVENVDIFSCNTTVGSMIYKQVTLIMMVFWLMYIMFFFQIFNAVKHTLILKRLMFPGAGFEFGDICKQVLRIIIINFKIRAYAIIWLILTVQSDFFVAGFSFPNMIEFARLVNLLHACRCGELSAPHSCLRILTPFLNIIYLHHINVKINVEFWFILMSTLWLREIMRISQHLMLIDLPMIRKSKQPFTQKAASYYMAEYKRISVY